MSLLAFTKANLNYCESMGKPCYQARSALFLFSSSLCEYLPTIARSRQEKKDTPRQGALPDYMSGLPELLPKLPLFEITFDRALFIPTPLLPIQHPQYYKAVPCAIPSYICCPKGRFHKIPAAAPFRFRSENIPPLAESHCTGFG